MNQVRDSFAAAKMVPVGTRFGTGINPDVATDRISHGFQVYQQVNAETGQPTGLESFMDTDGKLKALVFAKEQRMKAIETHAPELALMCQTLLRVIKQEGLQTPAAKEAMKMAEYVLDQSVGIRNV